jgi:hypothetical protein
MSVVTLDNTLNVNVYIEKGRGLLPKPISNRPAYDMKYCRAYLSKYFGDFCSENFLNNENYMINCQL